MRIKTQFYVMMLLFGILLVVVTTSAVITEQQAAGARTQEETALRISQGANDLSYLGNDYVIYRESQQLARWHARFARFSNDVASLRVGALEQRQLVDNIKESSQKVKEVFDSISASLAGLPDQPSENELALIQVSWSRMAIQSQGLASDASLLAHLLDEQSDQFKRANAIVLFAMIILFGAFFTANFVIVQRRALRSIARLREGAAIIGAGRLDYKTAVRENDEVGDLARAFNETTSSLKQVTASKEDLEREVARRIGAEEELRASYEALRQQTARLEEALAERRQAQELAGVEHERLTAILNAMEDGVTIMNSDFRVEYVNPALRTLYGDVNGRPCYEYFNGRKDMCPWCNNAEVLGGRTLQRETQTNRNGRTYEITDAPLRNADGTISKLAVFHDITERKKVEQLKDEFIGMVSHEIKTPLTVIIGALSTAADERVPLDDVRMLMGDAVVHAQILADIVENLLELSRQQSGRLILQTQPADVEEIVQRVIRKLAGKSEIHRLRSDLSSQLPLVLADTLRVERILSNLVDNAIKYSPAGGEVRIFARGDPDYLTVGVRDWGPGISRDDQLRLFQSFERLGMSLKGSVQGTGLGLRVCRILVEAHGGRIWVDSEPGLGSTFLFTLPVARATGQL